MACATGVHMKVVGDETLPGAGERISGAAFAHALDSMIVTVRAADVTGSQPLPKRAITNHGNVPAGSSRVALVEVVTAASESPIQSSYSEAFATALHENVAGEATLARFAGSCSDGGATNGHVGVSVLHGRRRGRGVVRCVRIVRRGRDRDGVGDDAALRGGDGDGDCAAAERDVVAGAADRAAVRVQFHGPGFMATKVVPAGSVSVTTTLVAGWGRSCGRRSYT
jgi:hypothetical protein